MGWKDGVKKKSSKPDVKLYGKCLRDFANINFKQGVYQQKAGLAVITHAVEHRAHANLAKLNNYKGFLWAVKEVLNIWILIVISQSI